MKWFAIPFSRGPHCVRIIHHDLSVLGGSTRHGSYFTELDKAVIHMISLVIFLGSKITADGDCNHEIKRRLLLGRKAITDIEKRLMIARGDGEKGLGIWN